MTSSLFLFHAPVDRFQACFGFFRLLAPDDLDSATTNVSFIISNTVFDNFAAASIPKILSEIEAHANGYEGSNAGQV